MESSVHRETHSQGFALSHPDPRHDPENVYDFDDCAAHEEMYRQWEEHMTWLEETTREETDE